jgi:hypothetical protein
MYFLQHSRRFRTNLRPFYVVNMIKRRDYSRNPRMPDDDHSFIVSGALVILFIINGGSKGDNRYTI